MTIKHPHCEWVTKFQMTDSCLFPTISSFLLGLWYEQNRHWLPLQHRKQTLSDYDLSLLFRQFVISLLCGQLAFEGTTESEHSNQNQGGACYDCKSNGKGETFLGYSDETLPKAQRMRGLSSAYQSNFFRSYHKFLHKSWSNIFRISTKHQLQNLNQTSAFQHNLNLDHI